MPHAPSSTLQAISCTAHHAHQADDYICCCHASMQAHRLGLDMSLQDLTNVFDAADIDHSTKIGAPTAAVFGAASLG
jgi:hypothetical protein